MKILLLPRLPVHEAKTRMSQMERLVVRKVAEIADDWLEGFSQIPVTFAEVGGTRVSERQLKEWRSAIRDMATRCGYPERRTTDGQRSFDLEVAKFLSGIEGLRHGEALRGETWQFISTVLVPDVVIWRWRGADEARDVSEKRYLGGNRNCFARLWLRALLLRDGRLPEDPWVLVKDLMEDQFTGILERGRFARFTLPAREIARAFLLRRSAVGTGAEDYFREIMKRAIRKSAHCALWTLEEKDLVDVVARMADETLRAMGHAVPDLLELERLCPQYALRGEVEAIDAEALAAEANLEPDVLLAADVPIGPVAMENSGAAGDSALPSGSQEAATSLEGRAGAEKVGSSTFVEPHKTVAQTHIVPQPVVAVDAVRSLEDFLGRTEQERLQLVWETLLGRRPGTTDAFVREAAMGLERAGLLDPEGVRDEARVHAAILKVIESGMRRKPPFFDQPSLGLRRALLVSATHLPHAAVERVILEMLEKHSVDKASAIGAFSAEASARMGENATHGTLRWPIETALGRLSAEGLIMEENSHYKLVEPAEQPRMKLVQQVKSLAKELEVQVLSPPHDRDLYVFFAGPARTDLISRLRDLSLSPIFHEARGNSRNFWSVRLTQALLPSP